MKGNDRIEHIIQYEKNSFKEREYSIFQRKYKDAKIVCEKYLFGISKRRDAETIVIYLNKYEFYQ